MKIFISGASSGIGAALAQYYAERGAQVGVLARRQDALQALQARFPAQIRCYIGDVSDAARLEEVAADYLAVWGTPDVVIASAGISVGTLAEGEDLTAFRRVLEVNVFGMVATFTPFAAPMAEAASRGELAFAGQGRMVGIASVAGIRGLPGAGAYSASKAAVIAYLESLRLEMRGKGVAVVTIAPGYIATPMTAINPYKMPFLLPVDVAAQRFARAIARGCSYTVIPWQMGVVAKLLRILPNWLYDRLFANAPRKPRGLPL